MNQVKKNSFPKEMIEGSIVVRFEQQVELYPEKVAVECRGKSLTYAELNAAANRLARSILSAKKDQSESIALLFEHDVSAIIAILGALKAGKAYVPLDPKFPKQRLRYMMEDSKAGILITDDPCFEIAKKVFSNEYSLININEIEGDIREDNLGLTIPAKAHAYILYSSGSTGNPKGIGQNHRNVLHHIWDHTTLFDINPEDKQALVLSISFAASVSEIFCPLLNGGKLCLYDLKRDGLRELSAWLRREEITIIKLPISIFRAFLSALSDQDLFPHLRLVLLGGDTLYRRDVKNLRNHFQEHCTFVNRLTSTETNSVTQFIFNQGTEIDSRIVPVGYSAKDKVVQIEDENGEELGPNEVGEIVIKSRYITNQYWGMPELTKERFGRSNEDDRIVVFHTGDLGRLRADGCLEHIGRKDFMVKVRGFRIEIAEVTAALLDIEVVEDAVVIASPDETGEKQLVGYIVLNKNQDISVSSLRKHLSSELPDYMIPTEIMILDELPKTPTGKFDYQNLPKIEDIKTKADALPVSPRSAVEVQLVEIWEQILKQENIGIDDDFFERGGNSLDALRMLAEVERIIGKTIKLTDFLQARTTRDLARTIENGRFSPSFSHLVPLTEKGSKTPFFCIPPSATTVMVFGKLAQYMGNDRPFYGFEYAGMDRDSETHLEIETMAKTYLEEMFTIQPKGPYYIGGMCFGGLVAYEMAQQLLSMNEEVAFLGILDSTHAPNLSRPRGYFIYLITRFLNQKIIKGRFAIGHQMRHIPGDDLHENQILKVFANHNYARMKYRTTQYPKKITLFNTIGRKGRFARQQWEAVASGGLEIVIIPGAHTGHGFGIDESQDTFIREPHVQVLAMKLIEKLDNAALIKYHELEKGSR